MLTKISASTANARFWHLASVAQLANGSITSGADQLAHGASPLGFIINCAAGRSVFCD